MKLFCSLCEHEVLITNVNFSSFSIYDPLITSTSDELNQGACTVLLGKELGLTGQKEGHFPTLFWCTRFRIYQGCLQSNSHQHNVSCRTPSDVRSEATQNSLYLEPTFKNMFYVTIIFCTEILRNPLKPQDWNTFMKLSVIKNKWIFAFFMALRCLEESEEKCWTWFLFIEGFSFHSVYHQACLTQQQLIMHSPNPSCSHIY